MPAAMRHQYDHRLRAMVCNGDSPDLTRQVVPPSTMRSWRRRGPRDVVTLDTVDETDLRGQIARLQRRVEILTTLLRLLFLQIRITGSGLDDTRLPDGKAKTTLVAAVKRAASHVPLEVALRTVGISPARFYDWQRPGRLCQLDDRPSCPKTRPTSLTPKEVQTMKEMVLDVALRHMPIRTLALHAQRITKLFASPATWSRMIRDRGWRRPLHRVYPAKPVLGVRATRPNEYWHLDVSVIRLLDGTRVYMHAVIDNFSRRILAWKVAPKLDPAGTGEIIIEAARNLPKDQPANLVTDSGVENVNELVDGLLPKLGLHRILAQVDVTFSNSVIEAFWKSAKHGWLYLHPLDTLATVQRLMAFYVAQHNSAMPHSAFQGQTPDEMYAGTGGSIVPTLAAARLVARRDRISTNRSLQCGTCGPPPDQPAPGSSDP